MEVASSPGGRATASRSAAAGGSATSAHGLLGGSGCSDDAGAAAAWSAARFAVRRLWRAFSVASAVPGWRGSLEYSRRLCLLPIVPPAYRSTWLPERLRQPPPRPPLPPHWPWANPWVTTT
eukprot:scaffold92634_cov56-Phaeocystis_antarctica.AAC.3